MTSKLSDAVSGSAIIDGPWDAVIVAGGKGRRLGGVSKPALVVGGLTLIERTLTAVQAADAVVVVGGPRPVGVRWTVEDPPGSGPAAGLGAGLHELGHAREPAPWTLVLAVDMPRAHQAVPLLLEARDAQDGVWLVDGEGHPQPLLALYRTNVLTTALAAVREGGLVNTSLRRLVVGLTMTELPDRDGVSRDLDTGEDARYWKEQLG